MIFDKASSRKSRGSHAGEVSRQDIYKAKLPAAKLCCWPDCHSVSRQELLAKVSSDRAVREASRRRLKAAVHVQRVYR